MLVEFSGGIKANSTESKENGDELKMLESMTKMLDYSEQVSNRDHPIPQFYVRSFGKYYAWKILGLFLTKPYHVF